MAPAAPAGALAEDRIEHCAVLLNRLRESGKAQPSIRELIKRVIDSQAGEDGPKGRSQPGEDPKEKERKEKERIAKLPTSELIGLSRGLKFRSSVLVSRLDEVGDDPLTLNEYFEVLKRVDKLEEMRKDQETDFKPVPVDYGGKSVNRWEKKGETRSVKRGFNLAGAAALRWYWVDYQKEWP